MLSRGYPGHLELGKIDGGCVCELAAVLPSPTSPHPCKLSHNIANERQCTSTHRVQHALKTAFELQGTNKNHSALGSVASANFKCNVPVHAHVNGKLAGHD